MAGKIINLINDESLRTKISMESYKKVQRYKKENVMPLWENLYENSL